MNTALSDQKIHGSKYPNGNWKSQNFCDNSTRTGYQVTWYESGQMKSAGDFNKGKSAGLHTLWFANGNKRAEINYKDGKRDGEFTFWHENGQIKFRGSYLSGQVVGTWTVWHDSGQKHKETDTIEGKRLYWHDNGQMKSRQYRVCWANESTPKDFTNDFRADMNWDDKGGLISSEIITVQELVKSYKKNDIVRFNYTFTAVFTHFNDKGLKEYIINFRWDWWLDVDDVYLIHVYTFFDNTGDELDHSIRFYEETTDHPDFQELFRPYSWCFYDARDDSYNAKDKLVYEYLIDQSTHKDIDLYDELLKIDNKKLNKILIQIKKNKSIFYNSYSSLK